MITASLVKELREKTGAGMLDCKKALEATGADLNAAIDWLREKGISKAAKKADRIAAEGLAGVLVKGNNAVNVEINSETDFVAKNEEFKSLLNTVLETLIDSDAKTVEEANKLETSEGTIENLLISKTATIGEKLSFRRFEKITKEDNQTFGSYIHMGGRIAVLSVINGNNEEVAKDVCMQAAAMRPKYVKREDVPASEVEHETEVIREQVMNDGTPAERVDQIVTGKLNKLFFREICLEEQAFIKNDKQTVAKYVSENNCSIAKVIRFEVGEGIEKKEEDFAAEVMNQINNK